MLRTTLWCHSMEDDPLARLSEADKKALLGIKEEYKRDGFAAFERLRERDLMAYCRIVAAVMPEEFGRALEDALTDAGLTKDDIKQMAHARSRH